MNQPAATARQKPFLDEGAFEQLLAAAYVVQQHNDRLSAHRLELRFPVANEPASDFTEVLSEIVEIQTRIQRDQLGVAAASSLVAERLQTMTGASATAIGIIEGQQLAYRGTAGNASAQTNLHIPLSSSLCAYCLRQGQTLLSRDAAKDPRVDAGLCREYKVASLLAVPILHEGKVAGIVELRFGSANSLRNRDVHTCQLMAGLIAEAMNRAAELKWKQVLAAERATMLAALEKLRPQLERLAVEPGAIPEREIPLPVETRESPKQAGESVPCRGCGNPIEDGESFCGTCGMTHPATRSGDIQSKWASMWYMQQASKAARENSPAEAESESEDIARLPTFEELAAEVMAEEAGSASEPAESKALAKVEPLNIQPAQAPEVSPWSSARKARLWLESLRLGQVNRSVLVEQFKRQRATIYLVIAGVLLVVVLFAGGGNNQIAASGKARTPVQPQLTTFEKVLVNLGLAVAPAPISTPDNGNPNIQVWVDLHTAQYYCPGDDLYGKTADGRYAKQREAQLDAFQPALRKACN